MDFSQKEVMKTDPLLILKFLTIDMLEIGFLRTLVVLASLIHFSISILDMYFIWKINEDGEFVRYIPTLFPSLYATCVVSSAIMSRKEIHNIFNLFRRYCWSIKSADKKIYRQIIVKSQGLTIVVLVYNFALFAFIIVNMIHEEENIVYGINLVKETSPQFYTVTSFIYKACFFPLTFTILGVHTITAFFIYHGKFQLYMFFYYMKRITAGYGRKDHVFLLRSSKYQREIERRLKFCIERLIQLKLLLKSAQELLAFKLLTISLAQATLIVSLSYYCMAVQNSARSLSAVLMLIGVIGSTGYFIYLGQILESVTDSMSEQLLENHWYTFSVSNKKLLLMLTTNMMKPFRVVLTQNAAINYKFGLQLARITHSIISLLLTKVVQK